MSLNELFALLGNLGASTRTGPIAPHKRCTNCGTVSRRCVQRCQCRSCPVRQTICNINRTAPSSAAREQSLMDTLRTEHNLLGIIVSKRTGKCIGIINQKGMIKHCDGKAALGPYRIMIKHSTHDKVPISTCNAKSKSVLGQCVDNKGKTVAEIVRKRNSNQIVLTEQSKAPVIATILPAKDQADQNKNDHLNLDQLVLESKVLIDSL